MPKEVEDKITDPSDVDLDELDEEEQEEQEDQDDSEEEDQEDPNHEEEEDQEDEEEDDEEEKITIEKYKELQKAATQGTQKLIHRNKAMNKAFELLSDVADDQSKLIDIYEDDQAVAEVILEKYYEGMTIQEFAKEYLAQDYEPGQKGTKLTEEEIRKNERAKIQNEHVEEYVGELFEKAKLSTKEASKVMEEYNELVEGKTLTKEKAKKYFYIAYGLVRKAPKDTTNDKIAKKTAASKGGGGGGKKTTADPHVAEATAFLKEHGIV